MPRPEDVNPQNYRVESVLFDDGDFSIAWGEWEAGTMCLAMRWNGEGNDPGYPKLFGNPVWFVLPESVTLPLLRGLIGTESTVSDNILDALKLAAVRCQSDQSMSKFEKFFNRK